VNGTSRRLKFFDVDLYGFVPFVGVGLGYCELRATDHSLGESVTGRDSVWMLSIPFGWDIRPNPASAWLVLFPERLFKR
jgi:hypothetical protein